MNTDDHKLDLVTTKQIAVIGRFGAEEMDSSIGYPLGFLPNSITEQVSILRWYFPDLGIADEDSTLDSLPIGAEGWFAIPRWEKIAPTYNEAVELVIRRIFEVRGKSFSNKCDERLGPSHLRQTKLSIEAFTKIGEAQKSFDILVVPAQFGLRHRGRSVRRSSELFTFNEFGLGAFAVSIMILTHPDRFTNNDDLWVDCSGDEYKRSACSSVFSYVPFFGFIDGILLFDADWYDLAGIDNGSASGFVP
jgi:hypothetical protein